MQNWETPNEIFDYFNSVYHFDFDLAADEKNHKCPNYFSESNNPLDKEWIGICWLNPPWGDRKYKLKEWIKKSFLESQKENCMVAILIPARTNTSWWHDYCMKAETIYFIKGRPRFIERKEGFPQPCKHGLPQPLAVIIFKRTDKEPKLKSYLWRENKS